MMDIVEIMELLPHRYPFLLVDRVVEMEMGKRIVAFKNLTMNEMFFQGHFPGNPIMPGVLIVEAMAQAGGVLAIKSFQGTGKRVFVYFMSVDGVKFRKPVVPGDQLRLEVDILQTRGNIWKLQGKALVGDNLMAEAEFKAMATEEKI